MQVSVVIRTKDEAARLRLTLASLERQSAAAEFIVVNDGSSDHTRSIIADAATRIPLQVVHHEKPQGRSGAANAGARRACGDTLLFLDGDTIASPYLVARHSATHAMAEEVIGRGETFHLRCTRLFQDPEAGTPRPGEEARVARMAPEELARLRVSRREVLEDFAAIERRAEPGIYPGAGPRRLNELEMDALRHHPDCAVLWAAVCGSNLSVGREAFLQIGGFCEAMEINEHRELALRLVNLGHRVVPVDGGRSYHMTHRRGWRDPLRETDWERIFYQAHPIPAIKLLAIFWAGLANANTGPGWPPIRSLPDLAVAASRTDGVDYDAIRRQIGNLPDLAPAAIPGQLADGFR